MQFKVSRIFWLILVLVIGISYGVYFAFTQEATPSPAASAESTLDSYLLSRHGLSISLTKKQDELFQIFCDETLEGATDENPIVYPCQNQNPAHKIILGEALSERSFDSVLTSFGNEQLFWAKDSVLKNETGQMECRPRSDYMSYRDVIAGFECSLKTSSGAVLNSSLVFLNPHSGSGQKVFLGIVGVSRSDNSKEVDLELLALLARKKETLGGSVLSTLSFFLRSGKDEVSTSTANILDSAESKRQEGSLSGNKVTFASGDGIDATVCDIAKTASCYPIYCNTDTAVWNYSLHKCVEPSVVNATAVSGNLCKADAPIWDGSKCRPLSGNIVSSGACAIVSGKNTCSMDITWSASSPSSEIEVRLPSVETIVLSRAASGTLSHIFPYSALPYVVELYESGRKVAEGNFSTTCLEGGFNEITQSCSNPRTTNISASGEYYNATGTLSFSCVDASSFSVRNADRDLVVATGTYQGKTSIPVFSSGNYAVTCIAGSYEGIPSVRYYNAPPAPSPSPLLIISPQKVAPGGTTTISWKTAFPNDTCVVQARVFCKSTGCDEPQTLVENSLNRILNEENTDLNDPDGSRPIKEALVTITPSTIDNGWYAMGKKMLKISYPTDIILSCGNGIEDRKRIYTGSRQTSSEE